MQTQPRQGVLVPDGRREGHRSPWKAAVCLLALLAAPLPSSAQRPPRALPSSPRAPAASRPAAAPASGPSREPQPLTPQPPSHTQFRLAREFRVQHLAGHHSLGSIIAMTFDDYGRMVLSRENGPIMLVEDRDKDGVYDQIRPYSDQVTNAQGLLSVGGRLYAVGSGPDGVALYRLSDSDQDGWLERVETLVHFEDTSVEHGPHSVVLGPDGYLYLLVGNHGQVIDPVQEGPYGQSYEGDLVQPRWQDPGGHAAKVRAPGGVVLRLDREGKQIETFAGGLRNPYDIAFSPYTDLFTHDADMESDMGTPWYRPTRVLHLTAGGEYGWRSGWAKWPEYFLDNLPAIAHTGRGSPTGAVYYDHRAFPARFHDALFLADWSEGRILFCRLEPDGAGYRATTQVFMEGQPLNVTDLEVGPDGALYVVTGGRDTAGNLYRISWRGEVPPETSAGADTIGAALAQPQLHSAWGRRAVVDIKQRLGADWDLQIQQAAQTADLPVKQRIRALQIMQWFGPQPSIELLSALSDDPHPSIRAAAIYFLGVAAGDEDQILGTLESHLADPDARVRRVACEALLRRDQPVDIDRILPLLAHEDRVEAVTARRLLEKQPLDAWRSQVLQSPDLRVFLQGATALLVAEPSADDAHQIIDRGLEIMQGFINDRDFIDLLRVFQLALHRAKLPPGQVPQLAQALAQEYPASDHTLNRELVRLLAYLRVDSITDRYLEHLATIPSEERIHQAMYLSRIPTGWSPQQRLELFRNLEIPDGVGNSVPGYLQAAAVQFGQFLPEEMFAQVLEQGSSYPGAALAVVLRMNPPLEPEQIEQLKQLDLAVKDQAGESPKRLKVAIVARLASDGSDAALEYLRTVYDRDPQRRAEVALGLAQKPFGPNWSYVVRSLPLLQGEVAREVLVQLRQSTQRPADPEDYRQVILMGLQLGENGGEEAVQLLEHWQGYRRQEDVTWDKALAAWQNWFRQRYPNQPEPVLTSNTQNSKWNYERLLHELTASHPESEGSAERGAAVFVKARCSSCHRFGATGESMGPDLTTVSRRFLRKEILDSILYPSQVISDQYAARQIITTRGRTYTGIVTRNAGQTIVLTPDGTKVALADNEIDEIHTSKVSAMPEGLLNDLTLEEVRDLFAFLSEVPRSTTARSPQPALPER